MRRFYLSSFLHDFGFAMMSMFVLFYLYQLGWSLPAVLGYVAVGSLFKPFLRHLANWLMAGWGPQRLILIGNILWICFTVALLAFGQPTGLGYGLLLFIAFLEAASHSAYYIAWDFNFISFEQPSKGGRQMSLVWIIGDLSRILSPLAGGIIAQIWGFEASLVVAGLLLLLSVGPLVGLKPESGPKDVDRVRLSLRPRGLLRTYRRMPKSKAWAFWLSNAAGLAVMFWALYLAIAIFDDRAYSGLGILFAASAGLSMLISWLVGRLIDRGRGRQVLITSSLIEGLSGGLRWFVTGIPRAVAHNFLQQQQSGHTLTLFQWYFDKNRPAAERLAFFQAYAYFHDLLFSLLVGSLIVWMTISTGSQLEILRLGCIILGLSSGLLLFGLALGRAFRGPKA